MLNGGLGVRLDHIYINRLGGYPVMVSGLEDVDHVALAHGWPLDSQPLVIRKQNNPAAGIATTAMV
jgi:hypothetical protein